MSLPISVCIIAHNEAHNIKRCLDSVQGWVSQICVVINDCTDGTDEIAKSYNCEVYEHPWSGHRDQKNIALGYAKEEWVLCLDCDEEVSPELQLSIQKFVSNNPSQYQGALFPRKVWFMGKWILHGDWYPDWSLRLIRNGKGKWGGTLEHDKMELDGKTYKLNADLHHYSNPDIRSQIEKINYFTDLFIKRKLDDGKKYSPFNAAFRSLWRFIRCYFIKLGFLDGFAGFYIASFAGFSTLVRYARLHEENLKK